ncbi:hypothetical protein [Anabaena sp. PCC 7108]|uniref:hypothetical protein n=1 Tax=Anabaena sp. PCC 7108 TaxID=163908 RepID=UPI0003489341|nr:hypothetical protein [Anabaena sp. PCC 7108]
MSPPQVREFSWAVTTGSVVGLFLRRLIKLFLGKIVGLAITWLIVGLLTGISAYKLLKIG